MQHHGDREAPQSMDENRIFILLEGTCPTCGLEVTIKNAGGYPEFREQMLPADFPDSKFTPWRKPTIPYSNAIGGITFVCGLGHENYIENLGDGDWA